MTDPYGVKEKIIIVTGAGGLLGAGYVRSLAEAGAIVHAWDVNEEKLADALGGSASGEIYTECVNILDEDAVERAVSALQAQHGAIHALVNNAAMNPAVQDRGAEKQFMPYEAYPIDLFRKELDANVTGMMITTKHVAPVMMEQRAGAVVNIASEVSTIAHDHRVYETPGKFKSPAYTASKAAVLGLTRQWAARLGSYNVRVNAVSIGGVRSPGVPDDFAERFGAMNMLGRMARPGEYDATIRYLCSDASSFMTGTNLIIDGGKAAW